MEFIQNLPPEVIIFFRYSAIAGLLAATTLLINFNHSRFSALFGDRTKSFWWLFLLLSTIPLFLFLFIFDFLFGKTDLRQYGDLVLSVFGRH